ncbi:19109_t:CDS:1, partial [Cetraspora pellucida]
SWINVELLVKFIAEIKKITKVFRGIDANFEILANRLDIEAPLDPLIRKEEFYQKFIHFKLSEILARWSAISEYY